MPTPCSSFSPHSPSLFFFPLLLSLSACRSLGSDTAVSVTLERSTRKAPAVKGALGLFLPLWKLDWRELKGPVCLLGERRAEELLRATHHLEKLTPNFFLFFSSWRSVWLCFHLLGGGVTAGRRGGQGVGGGNSVWDKLCVLHQWVFISDQWKDRCNELLTYDTYCWVL